MKHFIMSTHCRQLKSSVEVGFVFSYECCTLEQTKCVLANEAGTYAFEGRKKGVIQRDSMRQMGESVGSTNSDSSIVKS